MPSRCFADSVVHLQNVTFVSQYISFVANAQDDVTPLVVFKMLRMKHGIRKCPRTPQNNVPEPPKVNLTHTHTHSPAPPPLSGPPCPRHKGSGLELNSPQCSRPFIPSDSKASTTKSALRLLSTVLTRITKNPDSTTLRQLPASDPKVRTFEAWPRVFKLFQQSGFVQSKDGKSYVLQVQYARI